MGTVKERCWNVESSFTEAPNLFAFGKVKASFSVSRSYLSL